MCAWEDDKKQEWLRIEEEITSIYGNKTEWTTINDIIRVLNIIAKYDQVCHVLFPQGGGLDLSSAEQAFEQENIFVITSNLFQQVKPARLYFETFDKTPDWNYFMLETRSQAPIDKRFNNDGREEVYAFPNGTFETNEDFAVEDHLQKVMRYCSAGNFLFVLKCGTYNKMPGTYQGFHNNIGRKDFRSAIAHFVEKELVQ